VLSSNLWDKLVVIYYLRRVGRYISQLNKVRNME